MCLSGCSVTDTTLSAYAQGFDSQIQELECLDLPVVGKIPDWLSGDLVRNGPAEFAVGIEQYRHWFDGLSKLHKFSFASGSVKATCKFLATEAYRKSAVEGRIALAEFGTNPKRSIWGKLGSVFNHQLTDNANVNVVALGKRYLALTETVNTTEFDLSTLSTIGKFVWDDKLEAQVTTAHPHFDFDRKQLYNLLIKLGPKNSYIIYRVDSGSSTRKQVASINVKEPTYFHSFGMSANYIILVECPFVVNPLDVILGNKTYIQSYSWKANYPTRISVYSKDNGELVASGETEAFFFFHHVNAFEANGEVIVDLLAYSDAQIVDSTYLVNLRDKNGQVPVSKLRRLRISLSTKLVVCEHLSDVGLELPRIYYERFNGKEYNYLYAPGQTDGDFLNQLAKLNVKNGMTSFWREDGCYPGEPVFVARPASSEEDDGVLLSVVFDSYNGKSFLLILDAKSMNELARAEMPIVVPFGFHGQFFRA